MIDINTWPPSVAIAFGFAPFVISLSGVAMETYIARSRDFDLIIASLPNSLWLKQQIPFWGTTRLKSRCYLLSTICGAMLYPRLCIRLGMMDAEDLRNFPPRLRRRLLIASWLIIIGSAWLFIGVGLIKLSKT
ncbi:hypothetical protein D3C81_1116130 [compost metagenome]|jgi:hypothetical protein|uniref:Transmembrane protein n=1 Tax=Pseudomonas wadenswilerensis TaxID=1785161 RepID=A0A380SWF0_9PSED|nr:MULTISPECIES: hypothetical protein [Pseudomonas]MCE5983304.1 hypothetical protein [Pseudomonas sp. LF19]SUQ61601.1 hypothetical protein CCOS864_01025 [Pseudomonas wadenswilerensis]